MKKGSFEGNLAHSAAADRPERMALARELETLERTRISNNSAGGQPSFADAPFTNTSSSAEKIGLFRIYLLGVQSGEGICGKPKVKCGECPHQASVPTTGDIMETADNH